MENQERAVVLKQFTVAQATLNDTHGPKSGVVIRLHIQDAATGKLLPSGLMAMEAADALSFAQLLQHHAQRALAAREPTQDPQH